MKPERQAEVDSIPAAKAGVTLKKSHSSARHGFLCLRAVHPRRQLRLQGPYQKVPAQARIIARIIDKKIFFIFLILRIFEFVIAFFVVGNDLTET